MRLDIPIEMKLLMQKTSSIGTAVGLYDVYTVVPLDIGWPIVQSISGTIETTTSLPHFRADEQAHEVIPMQCRATNQPRAGGHRPSEKSLQDHGNTVTNGTGTMTILLWRTISGNQTTTTLREGAAQH